MVWRYVRWYQWTLAVVCLAGMLGCSSLPKRPGHDSEIFQQTSSYHEMGGKHFRAGRFAKACTYFERELLLHASVDDRAGVAGALTSLGRAQLALGDLDQAETSFRQAADFSRDLRGPELNAQALAGLGEVALHRRQPGDARTYLEEGLNLPLAEVGLERAVLLHDLGSAWYELGDPLRADTYLRQALAMNESLRNALGIAASSYSLALLREEEGDREQARQLVRRALIYDKKAENPPGVAQDLSLLGSLAVRSGNLEDAADFYRRAKLAWQSLGRSDEVGEIDRRARDAGLGGVE